MSRSTLCMKKQQPTLTSDQHPQILPAPQSDPAASSAPYRHLSFSEPAPGCGAVAHTGEPVTGPSVPGERLLPMPRPAAGPSGVLAGPRVTTPSGSRQQPRFRRGGPRRHGATWRRGPPLPGECRAGEGTLLRKLK